MKNVIIIGMVGINVKATIAIATPSIERLAVIIGVEVEFLFSCIISIMSVDFHFKVPPC